MSHLLAIYLQDHHAGSSVGVALARRAAGANRGNDYGEELAAIAAEIDEDRRALERVMKALDVEPARLKDGAARVAEKAGRLKRNGTWLSYSPLSRLVEIEGLETAVGGKQALWDTLAAVLDEPPAGVDFAALAERAAGQRERLEALSRRAAREAFVPTS